MDPASDWKLEIGLLRARLGLGGAASSGVNRRALLLHLALLAGFGVMLPYQKGIDFLDAVILGAYLALGVVFAAPAAAHPFDARPSWTRVIARIGASMLYGMAMAAGMLLLGLITVYTTRNVVVGPNLVSLAECLLFSLALCLAVTALAVWSTLRFSRTTSMRLTRLVFLALLLAFFFESRRFPDIALEGAVAAAAAGAVLLLDLARGGTRRGSSQPL